MWQRRQEKDVTIPFEEFQKIELKVARVLFAEKVEKSDKLLRLQIDLGTETRQLVAGIAQQYTPESMVGCEIIVVANLESRVVFGVESQGMLLAASSPEGPVLLRPDKEVSPGTGIR